MNVDAASRKVWSTVAILSSLWMTREPLSRFTLVRGTRLGY